MLASSFYVLGLCALILCLLAGLAIGVDVRLGRRYGLVTLALIAVALYLIGAVSNQHPAYFYSDHPYAGVWIGLTLLTELALFFLNSLAALLVAGISRHWRWFAAIAAALLPMLALAIAGILPNRIDRLADGSLGSSANTAYFYLALFCPVALCLLYGISRMSTSRREVAWSGD